MESTSPQDQSEFEALLEPILPSALKTALFLARSREDAEDLVQEAAILAFRSFERFERGTNFKAWFLKVQHNCFLGRLRHPPRGHPAPPSDRPNRGRGHHRQPVPLRADQERGHDPAQLPQRPSRSIPGAPGR